MTTVEVRASVAVDRPVDELWRLVADDVRDPQVRSGVVTTAPGTPGPVEVGTTTAEELRMVGRTSSS